MTAAPSPTMEVVAIGDHELAYRQDGTGAPVVLVHGGFAADMMSAVEQAEALSGFRRVLYHRHGHGRSPRPQRVGPVTLAEQAVDLVGLLDHLSTPPAHLVGHSLGALVILTAAAAHPGRVASLTLVEPPAPLSHPAAQQWYESVVPAAGLHAAGDTAGAVSGFYDATLQAGWRQRMDRVAPGAFQDSLAGARMAFESDLPGLEWSTGLTADQVAAIRCPVLIVIGERTRPVFRAAAETVHEWFPWCVRIDVPDADHMLPLLRPDVIATAVAGLAGR